MILKYLKHVEIPYYDGNNHWSVCPYTGSLLKGTSEKNANYISIPKKVLKAIEYCNEPYLCNLSKETRINQDNFVLFSKLSKMHNKLLRISNSRFYITRLYSSIKNPMFENTSEAITYINSLPSQVELKHRLCLQRAFLAAKISKSFTKNGVIFIGAFLPTGDMHAWIIENGQQADFDDRGWINYRPLLALYH